MNMENKLQVPVKKGEDGILRVETRIIHSKDSHNFRWPILLPNSHPLVDQLINGVHRTWGRGGIQFTLGILRQKYWILQGRKAVKRTIHPCTVCRKHSTRSYETNPAALPEKRVSISEVF